MPRRKKNGLDHIEGEGGDQEQPAEIVRLNSAARAETIREACETIDEYERQIDSLKAEIKVVIETRIKADLGMKPRDFALARKLHKAGSDQTSEFFDVLRETFNALGTGGQLDWLTPAGTDAAAAMA